MADILYTLFVEIVVVGTLGIYLIIISTYDDRIVSYDKYFSPFIYSKCKKLVQLVAILKSGNHLENLHGHPDILCSYSELNSMKAFLYLSAYILLILATKGRHSFQYLGRVLEHCVDQNWARKMLLYGKVHFPTLC